MVVRATHRAYGAFIGLCVALVACTSLPCLAQTKTPSIAPMNPEFARYLETASSGQAFSDDGYPTGAIPVPVDLSHMKGLPEPSVRGMAGLPVSYDLRTTGKLTAVRNQGGCGSCWSFAAYGSMESCLLPGESRNYSENNLKNLSGFDVPCCDGGNHFMTAAYLARWSGPVNDADDPYNAGSCTSPSGLTTQKHVQQILFLPDRSGFTDNDRIKQAVMTYGAVYTTMYWSASYYHSGNYSYYYPGAAPLNHAVCIVGWDDSYDKNRFTTPAPANGAFIVRNSWGTGWGQGGYFYISYYDTRIGRDNAVFCGNESVSNYGRVYQYDPLGWVSSIGYGSNTAWGANIFTASESGLISAAGFYAASPGATYDLYVYLSPNSGPIRTTGWAARKTGTVAEAGYHTVQFDSLVTVSAGQKFSIVLKLTTPGYYYPIAMERPESGYSSTATASAGQSYISSNGASWSDITGPYPNTNVCIKAYSTTSLGLAVTPSDNLLSGGPVGGPMSPSSITYILTNISSAAIDWSADKSRPWVSLSSTSGTLAAGASTQVTVSIDSAANGLPAGVYGDTVSFVNTSTGVGNTTRGVSLTVRNAELSVDPADAYVSIGGVGGPFYPGSKVYTVTNTGYSDLMWTASCNQPWISLSPTGGVLAAQEQVLVIASPNAGANTLPVGEYSAAITFANVTNGVGDCIRDVALSVRRNYDLLPAAFDWVDPAGHTALPMDDDSISSIQNLPFVFTFYGQQYSHLFIGANGLITLGSSEGAAAYSNTDIPNPEAPNAVLYPYWDDLDPSGTGNIRVGVTGTSPSRKYVISYVNVPHYSSPSAKFTFQVLLHETTNDITFQYLDVQPGNVTCGAGRSATVGIEDSVGMLARKYSYDGSSLLDNGQAFVFTMNRQLSIADAKRQPNGTPVTIRGAVVTGVFASNFYIESDDRSCGMAVYKSGHGLAPGMRADVVGTMSTNAGGEKYLNAMSVTQTGSGAVQPILVLNSEVGGSDWDYDPVTGAGQKGIKDSVDLNNIGLLVCTAGKVTYVGGNFFYVDDGSKAQDNTTYRGLKVLASGLTLPPVNKFVIIRGIASCSKSGGDLYRLLRATSVTVINP